MVVKNEEKKGEVDVLFETEDIIVQTIFTNKDLIDGGGVYSGDFYTEQYKMLTTIEAIIAKRKEAFKNKPAPSKELEMS